MKLSNITTKDIWEMLRKAPYKSKKPSGYFGTGKGSLPRKESTIISKSTTASIWIYDWRSDRVYRRYLYKEGRR